ncbi:ATP-binding protein [Clostridium tertium]|uniref:ATP-binding protein n=1 Tax=Clostridium tertium TaxID=1559 RepID=UPI001FA8C976|nr:ATP-binding protein [Clostridium tertium]
MYLLELLMEDTRVHEAVREDVANALIHADYRLPRGIVIEKGKTFFKVSNPGSLRITREEALKGGVSDPRNENIFKMFNFLGVGERAGSGLENIQLAWKEQEWLAPDLEELYDPDRILLTLRTVSMLPEESITLIKSALKNKYNELSREEEVVVLVAAHQEGYVTNNRLQQLFHTHSRNSSKILTSLVDEEYLETDGIGRGTKYYLSDVFKYEFIENNDCCEENDVELSLDEKIVLDFINKNIFITTKLCIETFGFGKTKSVSIFNKLIKLGLIKKVGSGSKISYILADED